MTPEEARALMDKWRGWGAGYPKVVDREDLVDLMFEWAKVVLDRGDISYSMLRYEKGMDELQVSFVEYVLTQILLRGKS